MATAPKPRKNAPAKKAAPKKAGGNRLNPVQWEGLIKRLLKGESSGKLSKEYGVTTSAISQKAGKDVSKIKCVAEQLVTAEQSLSNLSLKDQILTVTLADELKAISLNLASGAKLGAMTFHKFAKISNLHAARVDGSKEFAENVSDLNASMAFTQAANEAAKPALNLLAANKEAVERANRVQVAPETFVAVDPASAAKAYQRAISGE